MWKWTCPRVPGVINEYHKAKDAEIMLRWHLTGIDEAGIKIKPCNEVHIIVDDGKPCTWPGCKKQYNRSASSERR